MGEAAGLVGALIGFVVGWLQYKVISGVVVAGLNRTDRSGTPAERADYQRRIRLLLAVMVVIMIGGLPVMGYVIGRTVFG